MMEAPSKEIECLSLNRGQHQMDPTHYLPDEVSAVLTGPQSIWMRPSRSVSQWMLVRSQPRPNSNDSTRGNNDQSTVVTIQITPVAETTTENQSNNDGDEATNSSNSQPIFDSRHDARTNRIPQKQHDDKQFLVV